MRYFWILGGWRPAHLRRLLCEALCQVVDGYAEHLCRLCEVVVARRIDSRLIASLELDVARQQDRHAQLQKML